MGVDMFIGYSICIFYKFRSPLLMPLRISANRFDEQEGIESIHIF
eukprot:SAG31_NODE_4258_length_3413_cov_3.569101_1_plen_45_part_00